MALQLPSPCLKAIKADSLNLRPMNKLTWLNQPIRIIGGLNQSTDGVSDMSLNASKIVNKLAEVINGKGGGQPFYATCAGDNINALEKLISTAAQIQKQLIS